jgi:hypothetical protein
VDAVDSATVVDSEAAAVSAAAVVSCETVDSVAAVNSTAVVDTAAAVSGDLPSTSSISEEGATASCAASDPASSAAMNDGEVAEAPVGLTAAASVPLGDQTGAAAATPSLVAVHDAVPREGEPEQMDGQHESGADAGVGAESHPTQGDASGDA